MYRRVIEVYLNGVYWMARSCAPRMPGASSIVNVSSVHGLRASRFPQAAYSASKAGVIGLTKDLAQHSGSTRCVSVTPSPR